MRASSLTYKTTTKNILDLTNLYEARYLNLEPGFQRQSVWTDRDRAKLIDSILRNYPLPAIFLYKRHEDGELIFDVIDGKQRLESILRFLGKARGRFSTRSQLQGSEKLEWVDWRLLTRRRMRHLITGYEIPVIEVDGDMADIIDVFVRINSTGKALTQQEKRHARYYNSPLLLEAARLADRFEDYFREARIFSAGQISRMKHIELICELMLSLVKGDVLNKKSALDRVMSTTSFDGRQLGKASRMTVTALNRVRRMFPGLKTTRFRQVTDFYTLVILIGKFEHEGLILTDRRRNRLAWDLLKTFGTRVDEIRERQRTLKSIKIYEEMYRDYLMTVLQGTDEVNQRRRRGEILEKVLLSLFGKRDTQRGFTAEQRRILWNTAQKRVCSSPGCGKRLTWHDFTIDHIDPHSKGGRTRLENAALMCLQHNSAKGNRVTRRAGQR